MTGGPVAAVLSGSGPVIPSFGHGQCATNRASLFCWGWVVRHWGPDLQPRLLQHVELTALAVGIGFVIAFAAALYAYRRKWFEGGFLGFSSFLYTIPALALFLLFVPLTGLDIWTVEIGLVGYTLLVLFRNIVTGLRSVPPEMEAAAKGIGMTWRQVVLRVNLPMALPSIMAGIRIATVTTISLATVAADVTPLGLGQPIFSAIETVFKTELIAAGGLVILLALVADGALALLQRAVTPWLRAAAG
ncbi:MAG: ABC transporter permease [Acidimicrobiales bacterium]